MSLKKVSCTVILGALLGCNTSLVATDANAEDKATLAQQAIEKAEAELATAQSTGIVWQIIDKSTGSSSKSIDRLLKVAKKKQEAGEYDEAIRIANRVAEAAMLGVEQATSQKDPQPLYQN